MLRDCVHCGFCLPACPTYARLGDEADSPRGRLHLMQAVAEGRLDPASDAFQTHLERCLGCRACEPVCPAGVPYGSLLEEARSVARDARSPGTVATWLLRLFGSNGWTRVALALGRVVRGGGLAARLARWVPREGRAGFVGRGMAMLAGSQPWRPDRFGAGARDSPPTPSGRPGKPLEPGGPQRAASVRDRPEPDGVHREVEDRRRVALLRGCVQRGLFDRVQRATIAVLDVNGCTVTDAGPDQGCCGALHAHAGDLEGARRLARKNIEAFAADPEVPLLVDAAGCSAAMKDYGHWLAGDPHWAERAQRLSDRVVDATAWLATRELLVGAPLVGRVALHPPCHLQHAQGLGDAPRRVLERAVPGLELAVADRATECCGGAGVYGLTQPLLGDRLGAEKAAALAATGAVCVATGNPGCMMHIAAHLGDADIDVAHPVELLYESYRRAGLAD